MAANKTVPTRVDPHEFIASVAHPTRRADAQVLLEMMEGVSGQPATMWGPSIIGFGTYHYKYDSGREGDAPAIGFSPRSANLSLYVLTGTEESRELLAKLGKHKRGAACLYVNKLSDIDFEVLTELARHGFQHTMNVLHDPS
ncbi:DUF1801 domain-containing protein [Paeniglutamicibacter kerguelensis]|uniref:YdhG-like domain-containing protein n=1 Tax=Paeniglutamicibacter kerguelensis TaxID=254788 RepID=A0ABS4XI54_9MICC|nr:DUF1801 domain-containing protein [Paeniglutamicibacter kerguelensis]MBP2388155.1 hypothetical protein [Paeniglutamicibacter kerguelensis]